MVIEWSCCTIVYVCFFSLYIFVDGEWVFSFFFFKQKTAYEMRISDWSSDVCSSDLRTRVWLDCSARGTSRMPLAPPHSRIRSVYSKIGRASCRERVCQYV